ncbi:hypothetical protein DPMN_009933 [Dreissena polymorpha]|uniref:Uncharacterized protein n=1 Tax=Dreissena polymorpha TaxID=45954 RepID=A0A9D4N0K0_DREPO|nr:hypothetical protein DPMN_009933 [Dreissena polymorpha]
MLLEQHYFCCSRSQSFDPFGAQYPPVYNSLLVSLDHPTSRVSRSTDQHIADEDYVV